MSAKPKVSILKHDYQGLDVNSIKHSLANALVYSIGKDTITATSRDWFFTAAYVARDRLIDRWMARTSSMPIRTSATTSTACSAARTICSRS